MKILKSRFETSHNFLCFVKISLIYCTEKAVLYLYWKVGVHQSGQGAHCFRSLFPQKWQPNITFERFIMTGVLHLKQKPLGQKQGDRYGEEAFKVTCFCGHLLLTCTHCLGFLNSDFFIWIPPDSLSGVLERLNPDSAFHRDIYIDHYRKIKE